MNENNDSSSFLNKFSYIASKVIATMASISKRVVTYLKNHMLWSTSLFMIVFISLITYYVFSSNVSGATSTLMFLFFRHLFLFPEYCIKSPIKG